jgi:hypothetical protein
MRFALLSLLFVLGCGSTIRDGSGIGTDDARGSLEADGTGGSGPSGAGGSGSTALEAEDDVGGSGPSGVGGGEDTTAGVGGDTGAGNDGCLMKACFSESHILTSLKPGSTWTPNSDPTVDCPPLSELQDPEPGVCFQSEPTVEDPGDWLMCCYTMSVCCR